MNNIHPIMRQYWRNAAAGSIVFVSMALLLGGMTLVVYLNGSDINQNFVIRGAIVVCTLLALIGTLTITPVLLAVRASRLLHTGHPETCMVKLRRGVAPDNSVQWYAYLAVPALADDTPATLLLQLAGSPQRVTATVIDPANDLLAPFASGALLTTAITVSGTVYRDAPVSSFVVILVGDYVLISKKVLPESSVELDRLFPS